MGIAASQSCLYLDLVVMERFTVLLKPVRLKLKCDLNFQGRDGKSSHASFCKVLCSNIKSDLKPRMCRVVFSVQISFYKLIMCIAKY